MVKAVSVRATMAAGMLTSWVSRREILHGEGVKFHIIRRSHPLRGNPSLSEHNSARAFSARTIPRRPFGTVKVMIRRIRIVAVSLLVGASLFPLTVCLAPGALGVGRAS